MPKRRVRPAAKPPVAKLVLGGGVVLALIAGAYALSARDESSGLYVPLTSFSDVHGLAVHPEDPDQVFVATHNGLVRVSSNGAIERVGDVQDDLMGFSMHPTHGSTFWTSGHPRGGGNMGVRLSTDGGASWTTLWAEPVDFHAMTVSPADPDHLWGVYRNQLHESTDGGRAWSVVNPSPPQMRMLAADPADEQTLYATTSAGIARSADGGKHWSAVSGVPAYGVAVDPTQPRTMYAGGQGALWKSIDAGATFSSLPIPGAGAFAYLSVSPSDADVVYAATYETGLYRSLDAGASWLVVKAPSR